MRPSHRRRTSLVGLVCGALLMASASGCYRWQPVALGPGPTTNVRVTAHSTETRYTSARLEGDSVVLAISDSTSIRFARADVEDVEQRRFDWVTSAVVGAFIVTGWLCIYPGC